MQTNKLKLIDNFLNILIPRLALSMRQNEKSKIEIDLNEEDSNRILNVEFERETNNIIVYVFNQSSYNLDRQLNELGSFGQYAENPKENYYTYLTKDNLSSLETERILYFAKKTIEMINSFKSKEKKFSEIFELSKQLEKELPYKKELLVEKV